MDKIKKAFKFKDPANAVYQQDIERAQREHEELLKRMEYESLRRMNAAQNSAQNAIQNSPYQQQERYGYGWNDPRAMMNAASQPKEKLLIDSLADTNRAMSRLAERLGKQERRLDMLSGFYTWITEVHPEIAAQHKAMRDLYEAANSNENQTEAGA
jgi:hypothetical protein